MSKILVSAVCASFAMSLQAEVFDASGFSKTLDIVVPAASVAQGVALTDFPALVRLSASIDGFNYADFTDQTDGTDLAFVDADGNLLPHEIDTWNTFGESLVWVKVPSLQRGTRLTMYYGKSGYTPIASTQTWSAFKGVWHMNQSGVTAEPDVSGNGLAATPTGGAPGDMVAVADGGVVGSCRKNYTGGIWNDNNYLSVASYTLGDTFTFSGWFNTAAAGGSQRLATRRAASADAGGWHVEWDYYGGRDRIVTYGSSSAHVSAAIGQRVNEWVALTCAFDGSTLSVYTNGAFCASGTIDAATDNGNPLTIGGTTSADDSPFNGYYDEVRLCGGALSADRIAADYATATNPDFFQYGKAIDPAEYTKFVQITASDTAVADDKVVRDFPALVRLSESITGFHYSDFLAGGADLTFATADGIILSHEIDTWNTSGESLVWVKIPAFSNGAVLYAYWGKATASGNVSTNTWSGFKGVWHMNQSGSTAEPDVSGNGLNAVPTSNSLTGWGGYPTDTTGSMQAFTAGGVAGSYRRNQTDEAGYIHNYLTVPSYELGGTFTFSGWYNMKHKYGYHRLVTRKVTPKGEEGGWHVEWDNWEDDNGLSVIGSGSRAAFAPTGQFIDEWMALAFAFDGAAVSIYTNGAFCAAGTVDAVTDNGKNLIIGGTTGEGPSFEGYYDEIRLGAGALPAERIAADYKTIMDASFFTFGSVGATAVDPPVFDAPIIVNDAGTLKISVSMTSGTGTPYVRFTSAAGSTDVALAQSAVTGPQNYTIAVPGTLAADKTYSFAAVGINSNGGEVVVPGANCFYKGAPIVAKLSDAAENGPVAGSFSVSRADTYGDLTVNYAFSGTAVAGTDYVGTASGSVVIPDGASSATVSVRPKVNAAVNADTTVTFSFSSGLYEGSASSATMTIVNLAPAGRKDFKRCVEFTFPMNFLGEGETLTNFPVLVKLSTAISGFDYSDFLRAGGEDMMFTDAGNHVIPHEIDTWDDAGTSLVWVSVPELTKGTRIKMYYGNGVNPAGNNTAKWPGYVGVWHMGEASGTAYDSTTNEFNAVAVQNARARAADLVAVADGAVGAARVNQASTTYYDREDPWGAENRRNYLSASVGQDAGLGTRFTFSGWLRTTGYTEGGETVVYKMASGYNWGWSIVRVHTTWNDDVGVNPGEDVWFTLRVTDGSKKLTVPNMRNSWVHLFVSFDRIATNDAENPYKTVASAYANGVFLDTVQGSTRVRDNDLPLTFGNINSTTDGQAFSGQYDEMRLKLGASSANWAKAEYLTVTDSAFAAAGVVSSVNGGTLVIFR